MRIIDIVCIFANEMEKKSKILQALEDYFNNTPPEQLEKDWQELEKYNQIGPDVLECLDLGEKHSKQFMEMIQEDIENGKKHC